MPRSASGFTLVELAIAFAVLGIMAGVALPSMQRFIEHQRTSAAIGTLMSHMSLARMAAISRNRRTTLCPSMDGVACDVSTDWSRGWMLFVDENGNRKADATDEVLRTDLEPTSRHLWVASTSGRQQLRYLPDGRSAGANLTISICSLDGRLLGQVIVNNAGRPRSERPRRSTACPT